ncbi:MULTISPECIES: creatininase family protein [unclassified Hyphomicrobium]|uniref:creatininase family protein n=1 Tax=unclassified Hyphomicrobium TaxID=2619925 RepID=UPI000213D60F|nr:MULTISPECIES: creatininase family protein [unclassified Hyphomicrobium]CCB66275.1 putative creatinine amidohydrolase [Hyphomicrobium sp. MC1]
MNWADKTWTELPADLADSHGAAILPVGATEQHGPHLGTGMDFILGEKLCRAVGERTRVPVLPTLPYGCSLGHSRRWPGTIALQPVTLITLVKEIGDWAYHSGVRRLFIVNSHVTNAAPLRCALEMLRADHDDLMVAVINTATVSERVRDAHFADAQDWHANAAETALMLAIAPEIVRAELVPTSDDPDRTDNLVFAHPVNRTSENGVTGKPSLATVEDGQKLFSWMVDDLSQTIEKGKREAPPLDHSYFHRADLVKPTSPTV